jgi:hypothetical protein
MTKSDRACAYVAKIPPAISGQGGHDATFAVAKALVHDFALPDPEAWQILCEYNNRCSPPWSERQLRHKMESAKRLTRSYPKTSFHEKAVKLFLKFISHFSRWGCGSCFHPDSVYVGPCFDP